MRYCRVHGVELRRDLNAVPYCPQCRQVDPRTMLQWKDYARVLTTIDRAQDAQTTD